MCADPLILENQHDGVLVVRRRRDHQHLCGRDNQVGRSERGGLSERECACAAGRAYDGVSAFDDLSGRVRCGGALVLRASEDAGSGAVIYEHD